MQALPLTNVFFQKATNFVMFVHTGYFKVMFSAVLVCIKKSDVDVDVDVHIHCFYMKLTCNKQLQLQLVC